MLSTGQDTVSQAHGLSSRAAPRAGPAMIARKCGPAGPSRGRGPAWADNQSCWAVLPENVPGHRADEPDVLYLFGRMLGFPQE